MMSLPAETPSVRHDRRLAPPSLNSVEAIAWSRTWSDAEAEEDFVGRVAADAAVCARVYRLREDAGADCWAWAVADRGGSLGSGHASSLAEATLRAERAYVRTRLGH